MHHEVDQHVREVKAKHPEYFKDKQVLEVGSLNINGSIRSHFEKCRYIGLDVGEGPGVDIVSPIHLFRMSPEFDTVISTEMLEHDVHWEESLKSMYENLKPGGLLILTCAGPTRQEHGTKRTTPQDSPYTTDYYRNISIEDFESILPKEFFSESSIKYVRHQADLCFFGIKIPDSITHDTRKLQEKN